MNDDVHSILSTKRFPRKEPQIHHATKRVRHEVHHLGSVSDLTKDLCVAGGSDMVTLPLAGPTSIRPLDLQ